jgi:BsuBI/PstI restriction endonuclease domain
VEGTLFPAGRDIRLKPGEDELYARARELLKALDLYTSTRAAVLMVMLDETIPHHNRDARAEGLSLGACATTAALFEHVADRLGSVGRLDREGRDFHVAPLHRPGSLIERVQIPSRRVRHSEGLPIIVDGWPVAKNQFSGHRVTNAVRELLAAPEEDWDQALADFTQEDAMRARQAKAAEYGQKVGSDSPHAQLIRIAVQAQLVALAEQNFEFKSVYIDDTDGDRVSEQEHQALDQRGLDFGGNWRYPDALLVNDADQEVWIIDAVTSDGEVDENRAEDFVKAFAERGWSVAGFTTAYRSWDDLARRQGGWKNLAYRSNVWIAADGGRFLNVGPSRRYDS